MSLRSAFFHSVLSLNGSFLSWASKHKSHARERTSRKHILANGRLRREISSSKISGRDGWGWLEGSSAGARYNDVKMGADV